MPTATAALAPARAPAATLQSRSWHVSAMNSGHRTAAMGMTHHRPTTSAGNRTVGIIKTTYAPMASSSSHSWSYVARWSDGVTELVKDTAERVIGCAKQVLEQLKANETEDARLGGRQ